VGSAFDSPFHQPVVRKELTMSEHNVECRADLQTEKPPEKPEPMKIDEGFPWYTAIMMAVGLVAAIIAFVDFIVTTIKYGF